MTQTLTPITQPQQSEQGKSKKVPPMNQLLTAISGRIILLLVLCSMCYVVAWAQENSSTMLQDGRLHSATLQQEGKQQSTLAQQYGQQNVQNSEQKGQSNHLYSLQDGYQNEIETRQEGNSNTAGDPELGLHPGVEQVGEKNSAFLLQNGNGHAAEIWQHGDRNTAIIEQQGALHQATIHQQGNHNRAVIKQYGGVP